jgi:hypothetical protein
MPFTSSAVHSDFPVPPENLNSTEAGQQSADSLRSLPTTTRLVDTRDAAEASPARRARGVLPHIDLDAVGDDAAEFTRCLRQVRHSAGQLSNREIAARSGRRLSRWMVGEVLGKGALPKRDFLEAFLAVCGVPASERAWWDRADLEAAREARRDAT